MRTLILTSVAVLALAACQKQAAQPAPAPAASAPSASAAGPLEAPHRRAGLWEQTISNDGKALPMGAMRFCIDAASEAKVKDFGSSGFAQKAESNCSQHSVSRGLDGSWHFATTCQIASGGTIVSDGTASGDFSSGYKMHMETTTTGATYAAANGHHVIEIAGRWAGPCPAGMAGGDVMLSNGMKINGHAFGAGAGGEKGEAQ
jgi:hypothetical protein